MIYTVGTSNRTFGEFLALLQEHDIEDAVDVRSFPTSSRFPHFKRSVLAESLESAGIHYTYLGRELGGFRKGGYLAYMDTGSFREGLGRLEEVGRERRTAFFCSERFPWKCHRQWIGRRLTEKGWHVKHIIDQGKIWIPSKRRTEEEWG